MRNDPRLDSGRPGVDADQHFIRLDRTPLAQRFLNFLPGEILPDYSDYTPTRAKGNQTVAARLLGLSRFGLQKKLRRLSGEAAGDAEDE